MLKPIGRLYPKKLPPLFLGTFRDDFEWEPIPLLESIFATKCFFLLIENTCCFATTAS